VGEVLDVVLELAEEGRTMILVTHEMGFAREVASRVVFIDGGRIAAEGPPALLEPPSNERLRTFLARFIRAGRALAPATTPEPAP
jgi:ABC-type histidine transport system ATPase subunit